MELKNLEQHMANNGYILPQSFNPDNKTHVCEKNTVGEWFYKGVNVDFNGISLLIVSYGSTHFNKPYTFSDVII